MMPKLPKLYAEKHRLVRELFVGTADDNYTLARWCFQQKAHADFFWLALHGVEKYLKATLLLNGKSSKKYKHDIERLYDAVQGFASDLLPSSLVMPRNMPRQHWRDETVKDFIGRLNKEGQPDNRYAIYGYGRMPEDLWKLDQVVFSIRPLCQTLDVSISTRPKQTIRQQILDRRNKHWNLQSKLEETMTGKRGEEFKHALLNWNFPFSPSDYEHTKSTFTYAFQDSILLTLIYRPLECGAEHFSDADAMWEWVKNNIALPPHLITEMELKRQEIKDEILGAPPKPFHKQRENEQSEGSV